MFSIEMLICYLVKVLNSSSYRVALIFYVSIVLTNFFSHRKAKIFFDNLINNFDGCSVVNKLDDIIPISFSTIVLGKYIIFKPSVTKNYWRSMYIGLEVIFFYFFSRSFFLTMKPYVPSEHIAMIGILGASIWNFRGVYLDKWKWLADRYNFIWDNFKSENDLGFQHRLLIYTVDLYSFGFYNHSDFKHTFIKGIKIAKCVNKNAEIEYKKHEDKIEKYLFEAILNIRKRLDFPTDIESGAM
ncbi:MAG: hypothetical protein R3A45_12330 [Bdellovibrionota bacterium]